MAIILAASRTSSGNLPMTRPTRYFESSPEFRVMWHARAARQAKARADAAKVPCCEVVVGTWRGVERYAVSH